MKLERAGRNEWKSLKVGEIGIFTLPNAKAVESARVAVAQLKRLEDMDFERIVTNEPLTIAYRRLR